MSTTKKRIQTYGSTVLMLFKCIKRAQNGTSFDHHFLFSSRRCLHELECVTGVHLFCLLHAFTMLLHHTVSTYGMIIQSANVNRCVSVCLYLCVKKLRAQTTGHRPSQTGWARNVLTSPHTLPVHSYSSSFFCLNQDCTHP